MSSYAFSVLSEFDKRLPFILVGAGYHYEQETNNRPFGYPYFQWLHCCHGSGRAVIDGEEFLLDENSGILLYPEVPHEYYSSSKNPWYVSWITFGGYQLEKLIMTLGFQSSGAYNLHERTPLEEKISSAISIIHSSDTLKGLSGSSLIYSFLTDLYRYAHPQGRISTKNQHSRLNPVISYIERNYDQAICIEDLAELINVTPQHFCLLFKKALHTRPFEYVNTFRINKSKRLLVQHPEVKINEIARSVGYSNESYFSNIFKKKEGLSPRQFRQMNRM